MGQGRETVSPMSNEGRNMYVIEVWFQRGMQESPEEMKLLFQNQGL